MTCSPWLSACERPRYIDSVASVATIDPAKRPLPAPVVIDPAEAASQDAATRPYYRSLQGMRVKLDEGIGTCGKDGQSVPVGVGMPTIKLDRMTVGGTGQ